MEGPSLTTSSDLGISVSTNRASQPDALNNERPATPGTQAPNSLSQGPKVRLFGCVVPVSQNIPDRQGCPDLVSQIGVCRGRSTAYLEKQRVPGSALSELGAAAR